VIPVDGAFRLLVLAQPPQAQSLSASLFSLLLLLLAT